MPSLIATLGANISGFLADMELARAKSQVKGEEIGNAFTNHLENRLKQGVTLLAIEQAIQRTIEWGSKINDLSIRLGISTDAVQQWDFALSMTGGSIEQAVGFFERLAVARQKALTGSEEQIASFRRLGISLEQLRNLRLEDLGAQIARAFQSGDPQALLADLRTVGGKAAGALVPAFREGLADLLKDAPKAAGDVVDTLEKAGDAFTRLKAEARDMFAPLLAGAIQFADQLLFAFKGMLAIPVGFAAGMTEGLGKIDSANPLKFWPQLFNAIKSGVTTAGEALEGLSQGRASQMTADEDRRKRLAEGKGPLDLEADEDKKKKAADETSKTWMQHQDRLLKLEDELSKKKKANAMAEMTAAEKILELERQREELAMKRGNVIPGSEADLEFQIADEELQKQLLEASRKKDTVDQKKRFQAGDLSSAEKSGGLLAGFSAVPELQAFEVHKKNNDELKAIRKLMERMAPGNSSQTRRVSF